LLRHLFQTKPKTTINPIITIHNISLKLWSLPNLSRVDPLPLTEIEVFELCVFELYLNLVEGVGGAEEGEEVVEGGGVELVGTDLDA